VNPLLIKLERILKMNIFKSLKSASSLVAVAAVVLGGSAAVYAAATFGPSRPTFTWASPANYITFNSITDNPTWGDERQLLKVRNATQGSGSNATATQVTDNEDVLMTVYFHNDAESGLNLVATNTTVKFNLPSGPATTVTPTAYITADNATPHQVYASADLTSSTPFTVTYEAGSAKLYTNYVSGVSVSDNVVNGGALVGSRGTDGNVPGCAQFSGYVTILVKVHVPTTPTPTPTPTPTTPKALPNTGPGDVLGIFTGATAVGSAGHYMVSRRRNRR